MGKLEGQAALVTGGNRGIGLGIARGLVGEGAAVAICARDGARLERAAGELAAGGGAVLAVPADVAQEAQVEGLFRRVTERFGRLDILVNNAGAFDGGPLEEITLEAWSRVLGACLTAAFLCTRAAFRVMKGQGGGRILNIGSISAQRARLHSAPYTAAKHGIWGLTQAAALEGREHGIVVSCLHPGNVLVERRMAAQEVGRTGGMVVESDEPMMSVQEIAAVALSILCLPPHVNCLETIVLPTRQRYLGRG
ncbi:MAG: SDR family oxidoreductase [Candidatus Latescibacterota bacterium]